MDGPGPIAHTVLGDLEGTSRGGIASFLGVPYAAPPLGELRFAPPQPPHAWHGLRDATQHGPIAPQLPSRLNVAMGDFTRPQSEDCLTLTISTPSPDARARPVIVWLHGGAWISGAGSLDWYDGSTLAREGDLVFVGVNYRLGALGWLHHPDIVDCEPGTADMIAALSWVHAQIASFGGDPNNVTVMGQSAGATSIERLLTHPEAAGLFHRAVMQSGGFGRGAYHVSLARERAEQFLHLLDIDPQAADALRRLRVVEVRRLIVAQGELARANARFAQTMPQFMPVHPSKLTQPELLAKIAAAADGKQVLIGATRDEVHAFYAANPEMRDPPHDKLVERFGGETALARYRARRPGASTMDLLADLGTDETVLLPAMRLAETLSERNVPTFAYQFDWAPPGSRFRACHCIDLPFVFGNFAQWPDAEMLAGGNPAQMADLSRAVRAAWIAFAHTGSPRDDALPDWPQYDAASRATMCFGARIGVAGDPAGIGWQRQA